MLNLDRFELHRARAFVLEQLIAVYCVSADPRWTVLVLLARASTAVWEFGRRRLAALGRAVARQAARLARLAAWIAAADMTVAAGGR